MNITELRLLAYKKRNWQYTFIKLTPLPIKLKLEENDLKVNTFENESLVIVQSESQALLQSAVSAVMEVLNVNPYIPFSIIQPYELNSNLELQIATLNLEKINGNSYNIISSYLTSEVGMMEKIDINSIYHSRLKASIETWLSSAETIKISTYMNGLIVDATGSLDTAKVARLQDYQNFSLDKINKDYTNWFDFATLARLHYSLY